MRFLSRLEAPAYVAMRVVVGLLLTFHGMQKLFGWWNGHTVDTFSQLWVGGVIELAGGALVAIGLFTRPAAFIASGMMAVAYFQFHFRGHFEHRHWAPIVNHGEPAVVYCFVLLYIACRGAGTLAFDKR
ncbi:MAG TPA: DoxX family protein [Kofleriaceae bacterium]|nr:DoxX family protein [Kofleriaceae bacterium]